MAIQASSNIDTTPFIVYEMSGHRVDKATLLKDTGRGTAVLAPYTLMSQIAATGKWVPFTSVTATDGSAIPSGIYMGAEIAAAAIIAADVVDLPIITFGVKFDEDKLVIENSLTLDTIYATTTIYAKTVREILLEKSMIASTTNAISNYENA